MMDAQTDEERKYFFESAKKKAEDDVKSNPKDTGALTRWGGALLELANFMPGEEASDMVERAVTKFQQALKIDPKKHDALWCLGNAYTSQGFLSPQKEAAMDLFKQAEKCFKSALDEQPENPIYKKGLEMTSKAPDLYDEIQKQIQGPASAPLRTSPRTSASWWFDVLGYVTVIGAIMSISALVSMMNPQATGAAQPAAGK